MKTWIVREIMRWMQEDFAAKGIDTSRLDAEILLAHALGMQRIQIYMDLERPLDPPELEAVRALVQRRRQREPIAYILGWREFWGRRFEVSPAVLIPRPDTETLVEQALQVLPADASGPVIDLCTGSGCIGLTLAAERPTLRVVLTDLSPDALSVAEANTRALELGDRVSLATGDLFAGQMGPFAMVTANPPYVAEAEMAELEPDVVDHEPTMALVAGSTGVEFYERMARDAHEHLMVGGSLLAEVGAGQAAQVEAMFQAEGFEDVVSHRDLGHHERVVVGTKKR